MTSGEGFLTRGVAGWWVCGFVLVVGVCVVCVGPLGAACVVLGGGCVWDVFLSGLTAGEGSGMVFRAAALVVVWLAGSAGWFWDRGFVVSGLVW
ncbi:hypothetical protein [Cutibacterium acnes]|uniref:hypothetical protein n=6 Tax=Cutibacterium acnes TaxID=1747 RepID=UPI00138B0E1F|nr:hypothetical protein [Cutibacterium acnes]